MPKRKRLASAAAVLVCFLSAPGLVRAQDAQQPAPDNTRANKDQSKPTADQQKVNPSDRSIAQQIRKAIHEGTTLSTYAHNVKIISQDGKVTLRGPVRSEDEKSNIEAKAVAVAGQGNVTNELTVAPPK
jgi:hyperosmotically inducible periplasmic protein